MLAAAALVAAHCALPGADTPFLWPSSEAPWIGPPTPVSSALQQWGRERAPVARYTRSLSLDRAPREAALVLRALRSARVFVNGSAVQPSPGGGGSWRRPRRFELAPRLRPGRNELRIEVWNRTGPPLLSLHVDGLEGPPLRSDGSWSVSLDGGPARQATAADDTRRHPATLAVETPAEALRAIRTPALALALAGAAACLALHGRGARLPARALLGLAALGVLLAWALLYLRKVARLPLAVGFDARHHIAYAEWIRDRGSLPLASDGWATYHPPLFYALAAALGEGLWRLLPFAAGLAGVFAAAGLTRLLYPGDSRRQLLALGFAAVLPAQLVAASYFSNEAFHALLGGLALLATARLLRSRAPTAGQAALAGLLFGLAALAKFTALLLVPVAAVVLAAHWLLVERRPAPRVLGLAAAFALPLSLVAGWFYLRNIWVFGRPLVGNWSLPGADQSWWQQPGFHTPAYYTRFGEALLHPYQAGFHSFWDGVYSTTWGDGLVAGRQLAPDRHDLWSYDFMTAGYWLALPATLLLGVGFLRALRAAWCDPDAGRAAAFCLAVASTAVVALAFADLTLQLGFYSQAKASYALVLLGPLAACFADAAAALDRRLEGRVALRALYWGWLVLCAGTLFLGFAA